MALSSRLHVLLVKQVYVPIHAIWPSLNLLVLFKVSPCNCPKALLDYSEMGTIYIKLDLKSIENNLSYTYTQQQQQ